jgi:hypothetical protein
MVVLQYWSVGVVECCSTGVLEHASLMIADCRLQIEVHAFLTGGYSAIKSEILILKSKIAGLHYSSWLMQMGKTAEAPCGSRSKPGPPTGP